MFCGLFQICMGRIMLRKARESQLLNGNAYGKGEDVAVLPNGGGVKHPKPMEYTELVLAKNETEQIVNIITDEQIALLEKEKVMLELEVKNLSSRLGNDTHEKDKTKPSQVIRNHHVGTPEIQDVQEQYQQAVLKHQNDAEDLRKKLDQARSDIKVFKMEAESKDMSIERLSKKVERLEAQMKLLQTVKSNMGGVTSTPNPKATGENEYMLSGDDEGGFKLEGWLWLPAKNNKKDSSLKGVMWKKHYVVLRDGRLLFYKSDVDMTSAPPAMKIIMSKLLNVCPVTQNDIHKAGSKDITAEEKDISKIFQILYEDDVESRHPKRKNNEVKEKEAITIPYKGHPFKMRRFKSSVNCNACQISIGDDPSNPQVALECPRCLLRCHKEHVEEKDAIAECKAQFCITLLVMANSVEDQRQWVENLSQKIVRKGLTRVDSKRNEAGMSPIGRTQSATLVRSKETPKQRSLSASNPSIADASSNDKGIVNPGYQDTPGGDRRNPTRGLTVYFE